MKQTVFFDKQGKLLCFLGHKFINSILKVHSGI